MNSPETRAPVEKANLHPRNPHRGRYDFDLLVEASAALANYVKPNAYGDMSIDFANPKAVQALNRALLLQVYDIHEWDIPAQYLCPPIPGRADYIHYLADLLAGDDEVPRGENVRVLDIGVGANGVYPLIGHRAYGWHFIGSDIDPAALANVQRILSANAGLSDAITLRLQTSPEAIFSGVVKPGETFDLTLCNPPFHASAEAANAGSRRKWNNLGKGGAHDQPAKLNFGGQSAELYCAGGEEAFIARMVAESVQFGTQCFWFTTLVSKASSLPGVYRALKKAGALEVKTIAMAQGQKQSRFVAWTFLNKSQQRNWRTGQRT